MIDKILKETYVNPKVELTQSEYNELVSMAKMKAKKIEEKAREIYNKEGVVKIAFTCNLYRKRYGEVESERFKFECSCAEYSVTPTGNYEKTLFKIPQDSREKIAKHVKHYVETAFYYYFGEHMLDLNEIERLKHKQVKLVNRFIIVTVVGWMLAVFMFIAAILK